MNAQEMARRAYTRPEAPARTLRGIEYDLFSRVTQRLTAAWTHRLTDFAGLATALHENNRLWTTLAADVADADNGLGAPLRAKLFYLCEFTAEHSRRILAGNANPQVLVEINTSVMRGLRGDRGAT